MIICCFDDIFEKLLVLLLGTKSPSFPSLKKNTNNNNKSPYPWDFNRYQQWQFTRHCDISTVAVWSRLRLLIHSLYLHGSWSLCQYSKLVPPSAVLHDVETKSPLYEIRMSSLEWRHYPVQLDCRGVCNKEAKCSLFLWDLYFLLFVFLSACKLCFCFPLDIVCVDCSGSS